MFISSYQDRRSDTIVVWEKTESGKRIRKEVNSPYYFYAPDKDGIYEAITGEKLKKVEFNSKREFDEGCYSYPTRFESDIYPQDKVMMTYFGSKLPVLTVGFIDIEVDYSPSIGFSSPKNPYAAINAITLYRSDLQSYFTLAVPSFKDGVANTLPEEMLEDNYFLFNAERELLDQFLVLIEDCDILSGWNSEFFDVPYIAKRIEILFGPTAVGRLGFPNSPMPRWGEKDRFKGSKEKEIVIDLISRVHLDYMALFKKFTLGGRQSYSLNAITEEELDVPKLHYEGTLAELYVNDFIHFCKYNRHDVTCLVDLDKKFKYIDLANAMVHEATVNFSSIFGSVQLIDTAIINFAHSTLNKIVFDKKHKPGQQVEGAIVVSPKVGLHRLIGSVDIKSLYPSTYRTLNLSPEKIVGQLAEYEEGWRAVYNATKNPNNQEMQDVTITIIPEGCDIDEGREGGLEITAGNMIRFLHDNKYALSAYGTILDQGNGQGLIPAVLTSWFNARIELQGFKKKYAKLAEENLKEAAKWAKDNISIETLAPIYESYIKNLELSTYYDMLQGVKKVLLNSLYGATLNEYCRFGDSRLGASTTGSGRQITTHMLNTINMCLMGEDATKLVKTVEVNKKGEISNNYTFDVPYGIGVIAGDTDSGYFVMDNLIPDGNIDDAIICADSIKDSINESFPAFIREAFHCQPGFDTLIEANREVVAKTGIFRAKKKYVLLVANMEGKSIDIRDPKKAIKTQGSDIKVSSTPETIRAMLTQTLMSILLDEPRQKIDDFIIDFRRNLNNNPGIRPLDYATITSVKNLNEYLEKYERIEKPGLGNAKLPGNVRASINHNLCLKMFAPEEQEIISGMKIKIIWLKSNEHNFASMAFSSDLEVLPKWFTDNFEVDVKLTELKLVDQKLNNIFEPIGWTVPTERTLVVNKLLSFD